MKSFVYLTIFLSSGMYASSFEGSQSDQCKPQVAVTPGHAWRKRLDSAKQAVVATALQQEAFRFACSAGMVPNNVCTGYNQEWNDARLPILLSLTPANGVSDKDLRIMDWLDDVAKASSSKPNAAQKFECGVLAASKPNAAQEFECSVLAAFATSEVKSDSGIRFGRRKGSATAVQPSALQGPNATPSPSSL